MTHSWKSHRLKSLFAPKSILVLCVGNHCRSPIAEALLQCELGHGIRVESAGLGAQGGYAPHPESIRIMATRGFDISGYRSRQVTLEMALSADLILVMDEQQKKWCGEMAPSALGRIYLLGHWLPPDDREISDPLGKDPLAFNLAFERIQRSVLSWRTHLRTD